MSRWEAYRIWLKDHSYEIAVARNREEAINIVIREKKVKEKDIVAVGKATSRGRLFNYRNRLVIL